MTRLSEKRLNQIRKEYGQKSNVQELIAEIQELKREQSELKQVAEELGSDLNKRESDCFVLRRQQAQLERERDEAIGTLALSQDEYVQQVGTWKIIQRLEQEKDEIRQLWESEKSLCVAHIKVVEERDALLARMEKLEKAFEIIYPTLPSYLGQSETPDNLCLRRLVDDAMK